MIEPNILAFQNAALLEALADPALRHLTTIAALAEHLGKDKSNLRKTMALLVEADLLLADPLQHGLTVNGHAQLAAFKRAQHGGERRKSRGRWPLDKLQRNPANRTIDPDAVLGLADTIVSAGDILQPLTLSPPDAHGVRTIWIGERRWIAATRLLQLGQLPDALVEGVPFVEREANAGEAAVITLIENTARQDLTPWEDAQQLRRAAEAHPDWSASELARRIGRAREGDRGGVRDVQQKLKIAREATPEAVARYEADPAAPRAWEDLRDSVTQPKPVERPNPTDEFSAALKAHGAAAGTAVQARALEVEDAPIDLSINPAIGYVSGEPYEQRFDLHNPTHRAAELAPELDWPDDKWAALENPFEPGSFETLMLPQRRPSPYGRTFPRAQIQLARLRGSQVWVSDSGYSLSDIGSHGSLTRVVAASRAYPDRNTALAAGVDGILASIGRNKRWKVPADILAWLQNPTPPGPHVVNCVDYFNAARAGEARRSAGLEKRHANYSTGPRSAEEEPTPLARSVAEHLQDRAALAAEAEAPPAAAPQPIEAPVPEDAESARIEPSALQAALEELIEVIEQHFDYERAQAVREGHATDDVDDDQRYVRTAIERAEAVIAAEGHVDPGEGSPRASGDGEPAVPVRKSIAADSLICLECGMRFKGGLKRHLITRHGLDPAGYRAKWALPADYPMVAPMAAKERDDQIRLAGLGLSAA